jgi:hypothetical protein
MLLLALATQRINLSLQRTQVGQDIVPATHAHVTRNLLDRR